MTESVQAREQWTALAIDTARARLDAKAPHVDVTLIELTRPLLNIGGIPGGGAGPVPDGNVWTLPAQNGLLVLRAKLAVTNRGVHSAYTRIKGDLIREDQPNPPTEDYRQRAVKLDPGETYQFFIEASHPIEKWVENYSETPEIGSGLDHLGSVTITVSDDHDNGVDDAWEVAITGSPIIPYRRDPNAWQLRPMSDERRRAWLCDGTPQRTRTYWVSRSARAELPKPPRQ